MSTLYFCKGCLQHLPVEAFQKNVGRKDDLRTPCKLCIKERRRGNQVRRWKRGENRGSPEKREARRLLRFAVAFGQISKPDKCEVCGESVPKKFLDGHHSDYSKPLQVRWLCRSCHGMERITWTRPPSTEQAAKRPAEVVRSELDAMFARRRNGGG